MVLTVTAGKVGHLLMLWAIFLAVGAVGLTLPFVFMIVGTILYLFA